MKTVRVSVTNWAAANAIDILIALAAAAAIVGALYGVRGLILRAFRRLGPNHPFAGVLIEAVQKTKLWFLVPLALQLVQGFLHPPQDVSKTIAFLFTIAAAFQVAIWARSVIIGLIEARTGASQHDNGNLASAFGIIRLLVSVAVFAIAAIVVLDNLGVNVTGLVAGLGIGGIAIGLAAQGIFADLFAALSIIFDKPFRVGDTITYQGKEGPVTGTVKKIGLKSTRILALSGELRIIGNTQLLAQEVTNYAGRQMYRFEMIIGVIYQTRPELLTEIPRLMEAEVERAGQRLARAGFRAFGPSSIDYDFIFEVDHDDGNAANAIKEQIAFGLLRAFAERGIEFAYPTQTTFTAAPDGRLIMPYPEVMPVVEHHSPAPNG